MSQVLWVNPSYISTSITSCFNSIENICCLQGEKVSRSPHGFLLKVHQFDKNFYVKIYTSAGKYLRRFIGRSRNKAEFDNLQLFQKLGIKTPIIVAFGEKRFLSFFQQGALVMEELQNVADLVSLTQENFLMLNNRLWRQQVLNRIADYTRILHQNHFIHNDLKWRNILVCKSEVPEVYFIDCPSGKRKYGWFKWRGIIKDLACLDKKAKYHLSKSDRLRFYYRYYRISKLTPYHRRQIKRVLNFFNGRE